MSKLSFFGSITKSTYPISLLGLAPSFQTYKINQIDMLKQALEDLRRDKNLKLDDVSVKEIALEDIAADTKRTVAVIQVPSTLDPTNRRFNGDVLNLIKAF